MSLEQRDVSVDSDPDAKATRRNAFIASCLGWLLDGFENYTVVLVAAPVVAQ